MKTFFKRNRRRRLEVSYKRWMRYAYTTAPVDKKESKRAFHIAEEKLKEIQGLLQIEFATV